MQLDDSFFRSWPWLQPAPAASLRERGGHGHRDGNLVHGASGQTFSKSLPYSTTAASGRTVVRGVVSLTATRGSTAPCSLAISLETFDTSTGVTHTFVPLDGSFSAGRGR